MCGLIGGVGRIPSPKQIETAMRRLKIRGPDAQVVDLNIDYWLGHTLLAIRKPPQTQPIYAREARIALVFNGELYDTAAPGANDTAALLARLVPVLHAADPLQQRPSLNGDFAFAAILHDGSGHWQRLLLGRDPAGVKPLYYCVTRDGFRFASSIRALVCCEDAPPAIDRRAVAGLLRHGSIAQPRTIFDGIHAVMPGEWLLFEAPDFSPCRRTLPAAPPAPLVAGGLLRAAMESTTLQVRDVIARGQVATVFFSGGVDSALLAHLMKRAGARVALRTLAIKHSALDEGTQATKAARSLGLPLETVELDPEGFAEDIDRCLRTMDQPTADAINAALLLSRGTPPDGRVVFTGTGLDELYNGYVWNDDCLRHFSGKEPSSEALAKWLIDRTSYCESSTLERLLPGTPSYDLDPIIAADRDPTAALHHRLRGICLLRFTSDRLLRDLDDVGMQHGCEARVPFLGHAMLAHAASLPAVGLCPETAVPRTAYDSYLTSPLKRHVVDAARVFLPLDILAGTQKRGFVLPYDRLMAGALKERLPTSAPHEAALSQDLIDPEALSELSKRKLPVFGPWLAWTLYAIERWLDAVNRDHCSRGHKSSWE